MTTELPVSCNRGCGAGCPLIARVEKGKVTKIFDNPARGTDIIGCVRGYRFTDTAYSPNRITTPLLRRGERGSGEFTSISWEEALQRIAENLGTIRANHGGDSLLTLSGSGSCRGAVHNTSQLGKRFFSFLEGCVTWGNYSCQAMDFTLPHIFGTRETGLDPATLEKSKLIILWGGNVSTTRFGASLETCLRKAKDSGTEIIVIDPRQSSTVRKLASRWIPVNPGTDSVLMAALLHVLISRELVDRDFLDSRTIGFDAIEDYIMGRDDGMEKDPAWAAAICGIEVDEIINFALHYGKTKPSALLPGYSIQRTLGGEDAVRFAAILQAATGNIGLTGGSSGTPSWGGLPGPFFPMLPVPAVPPERRVPVYLWAETVLQREMKCVYNIGVNYLTQGANIETNIKAFLQADFICTHELFITPTARYSDIILPATTWLEREDVVFPSENYLYYSAQAAVPPGECRNDYDILCDLAGLLGFEGEFSFGKTASQWLADFFSQSAIQDISTFKKTGIFDGQDHYRTGLKGFAEDPDGQPLPTPSGRIELSSQRFEANGFNRIPLSLQPFPPAEFPLRLISPHAKNRVNSQNSNLPWRQNDGAELMEMHPDDAREREITDGEKVRVISADGKLTAAVRLTEEVKPGVVCLRQGTWISRNSKGEESGASANWITSAVPTMPSYGSRTHLVWVKIEKFSG